MSRIVNFILLLHRIIEQFTFLCLGQTESLEDLDSGNSTTLYWRMNITCPKSVKRTPAHALFTPIWKTHGLLWEMLKMEIGAATIAYSKKKAKATTNRELEITRQLEILDRNICDNFNSPDIARILKEYEDLKIELQSIYEDKGRVAIFRSKCRWVEKGEVLFQSWAKKLQREDHQWTANRGWNNHKQRESDLRSYRKVL